MRLLSSILISLSVIVACNDDAAHPSAPYPEVVRILPDELSGGGMRMLFGNGHLYCQYSAIDGNRWMKLSQQGDVIWSTDINVDGPTQIDESGNIHIVSGKKLTILNHQGDLIKDEDNFFDKLQPENFLITGDGHYVVWGQLSSFNTYGIIEKWTMDGEQVFRTVIKANTWISSVLVDGLGDLLIWGRTTRDLQTSFLLKLTRAGEVLWYRHNRDPDWVDTGQSNYNQIRTFDLYPTAFGSLYAFMASNNTWIYELDYEGHVLDSSSIPNEFGYGYVSCTAPNANGDVTLLLNASGVFHNGFFGKHFIVHLKRGLTEAWRRDIQSVSMDQFAAARLMDNGRVALWGKIVVEGLRYQPILIIIDPSA